jgi:N-acetylneuraminic acid mutarotase
MYDPASDSWTKLANMPSERGGIWAALLNGKVYVCGIGWKNEALATAEEYDPKSDSWRKLPDMPTPRFLLAVEAVGNSVYAIGGAATDFSTLDAVEAFTP